MGDVDGPAVAKAVYQALFSSSEVRPWFHIGYRSCDRTDLVYQQIQSLDELEEPTIANTAVERKPTLASFSLARVVDDIARHLRLVKKVPAERWATFVHVGI